MWRARFCELREEFRIVWNKTRLLLSAYSYKRVLALYHNSGIAVSRENLRHKHGACKFLSFKVLTLLIGGLITRVTPTGRVWFWVSFLGDLLAGFVWLVFLSVLLWARFDI